MKLLKCLQLNIFTRSTTNSKPHIAIPSHINSVHVPHPIYLRSTLTLSSHLRLVLPSAVFPSDLLTKALYALFLFLIRTTCSIHINHLDIATRIFCEKYRSWSFSLCLLSLPAPTFLSPLFSDTPSLRSYRNIRDHVSHPYKTKGKIVVLYIWKKWKTKDSGPNDSVTKYVIYQGLGSNEKQSTRLFLCMYCAACIQFLFQPTTHNIFFYLNNTYIIISPTCFDTLASSAGRSEVVLRLSCVVSILLNFH